MNLNYVFYYVGSDRNGSPTVKLAFSCNRPPIPPPPPGTTSGQFILFLIVGKNSVHTHNRGKGTHQPHLIDHRSQITEYSNRKRPVGLPKTRLTPHSRLPTLRGPSVRIPETRMSTRDSRLLPIRLMLPNADRNHFPRPVRLVGFLDSVVLNHCRQSSRHTSALSVG